MDEHHLRNGELQQPCPGGIDVGGCGSEMLRVVLVDDDVDLLEVLGNFLTDAMFEVIRASNALDAISYLEIDACDILLSDVQMPGLSGIELAKWVSTRHPSSQIILTSGEPLAPANLQSGWAFLLKPIDLDLIQMAMGKSISR